MGFQLEGGENYNRLDAFAIITPYLTVAFDKYHSLCQDPKLCQIVEAHEKAERDWRAELSFAREEGYKDGLRESILEQYLKRFPNGDISELKRLLQKFDSVDTLNCIIVATRKCPTESEFLARVRQVR